MDSIGQISSDAIGYQGNILIPLKGNILKSKLIGTSVAALALLTLAGCSTGPEQSTAEACQIINDNTENLEVVDAEHIKDIDKGVTNKEVSDAFNEIKTFMIQAVDGTLDENDTTKYQDALIQFENLCYSDSDTNDVVTEDSDETIVEQSDDSEFVVNEDVTTEDSVDTE